MTFTIESIKYRVGENQKAVQQICIENGRDYERLIARSGFKFVHRTGESDQIFFARFINENLDISDGDFIILVNQSMPSLIPGKVPKLFADRLDARSIGFLEVSDGCTGFARALIIANALLDSKAASRVHITCAEKYSQFYGPGIYWFDNRIFCNLRKRQFTGERRSELVCKAWWLVERQAR